MRFRLAAIVLVSVASVRIVATYKALSQTTDEPAHLAAGMEWLERGTYTYEPQHPPLARVAGAIGLRFAGVPFMHSGDLFLDGDRMLGYGHRYDHNLFYGRLAILPFFWIACAVVFLWARRISGDAAAVTAVLIFTTIPPVLGHAGLATTDMALAAFTGAAAFAGWIWIEKPSVKRSLVFGVLAGLAVSSKFSALVFIPAALIALYGFSSRPALLSLIRPALMSALAACCVMTTVYRFAPLPALYEGIQAVWRHNAAGHPAWLLGRRSLHGFWYYFPVVSGLKTPLALLILTIAAMGRRVAAAPLAFAGAVILAASFGSINIGIRHILPIFIGLSVGCGTAAAQWIRTGGTPVRVVFLLLIGWQIVSGALCHPEYIAYTNELAGSRPDRLLADSDLDWGQDMKLLAKRIYRLGVPDFTFKMSDGGYIAAGNDFPFVVQMPDGDRPRPGWNAVAITAWRTTGEPRWAEKTEPRERIGRSILLYYFPEQASPRGEILIPSLNAPAERNRTHLDTGR